MRRSYIIAAACVAVTAGLLVLGATAQRGVPGQDHYVIKAEFANASNVGRYAEVRVAGRRVGQVTDIGYRDGVAQVRLQLTPDLRPLRADTTARVRLKGLLGAKFIELRPGSGGSALRDGATLPVSRTSSSVELFDVVAALDARRRKMLGATVDGLGKGFAGRGPDLNEALRTFPDALVDMEAVARAVNGRDGAAARLFPSANAAAGAFDAARDPIASGWDPQARALAPFADRRSSVQAALDVAPATMSDARSGLAATDPLLRASARLARATTRLTAPAPRALREMTAVLDESNAPLRRTHDLLIHVERSIAPTLLVIRRVDPLIPPLGHTFTDGLPLLNQLDVRSCDFLGFARNWRGMLGFGVDNGHPVGPMTALRVANHTVPEQTVGDVGVQTASTVGQYPEPCGLGPVEPLEEATR